MIETTCMQWDVLYRFVSKKPHSLMHTANIAVHRSILHNLEINYIEMHDPNTVLKLCPELVILNIPLQLML